MAEDDRKTLDDLEEFLQDELMDDIDKLESSSAVNSGHRWQRSTGSPAAPLIASSGEKSFNGDMTAILSKNTTKSSSLTTTSSTALTSSPSVSPPSLAAVEGTDDLFGNDRNEFAELAAGADNDSLASLTADKLREENRSLRRDVGELMARLRLRDEQLAQANRNASSTFGAIAGTSSLKQDSEDASTFSAHSPTESPQTLSARSGRSPSMTLAASKRNAKDLLLSHLADAGFSASNVENVLDDITFTQDSEGDGTSRDETRMMNAVLDRLLNDEFAILEGGGAENGATDSSSWCAQKTSRVSNGVSGNPVPSIADPGSLLPDPPTPGSAQQPLGLNNFGMLDHSAGFLSTSNATSNDYNRQRAGRSTNLAQFGLFADAAPTGDEDDTISGGISLEESGDPSSSTLPSSSLSSSESAQSTSSQRSDLFHGVKDVTSDSDAVDQSAATRAREGEPISYEDFIGRLMRPESADLVRHVRLYVSSVLGPNGNGTEPKTKQQLASLEYRFYGTHMLQERCADFFRAMEKAMSTHAAWRGIGETGLMSARNNLEKYVMTKIADLAIAGVLDEAQDRALTRRMEILDFITAEALDVNPNLRNEVVWPIAQDELRKMAHFRAPGDKIACVVNCCQVIFSVLNLKRGSDDTSRPGADDFLPIFIYVVLKAKVPSLYTNCEYIQSYLNPAALMSKAGYCFGKYVATLDVPPTYRLTEFRSRVSMGQQPVNLRSAIEFILTLDASVINMGAEEFEQKLAESERRYEVEH